MKCPKCQSVQVYVSMTWHSEDYSKTHRRRKCNLCKGVWTTTELDDQKGIKVRPVILRFAELMEKKLQERDHKTAWADHKQGHPDPSFSATNGLKGEVEELMHAISFESAEDVAREAADVANFAMMIADMLFMKTDVADVLPIKQR